MSNQPQPKPNNEVEDLKKKLAERDAQMDKFQTQLEQLTQAADQRKLAQFAPKESQGTKCKVSLYRPDDRTPYRLVKSWSTIANVATPNGKGDDQRMELTLEDESKIEMKTQKFLVDGLHKEMVEIVEKKQRGDDTIFTIRWNGKEYELPITFIN